MASTFELEIVTPDRNFFEGEVEMIVVRTVRGDVGILKDHIPFVSPLAIGSIRIKKDGKYKEAACADGFIRVSKEKTTILTDSAEWAEEIDIERAKASAQRAEDRLKNSNSDTDVLRAQVALKRALNRLKVAQKG
jgi:F-type H+-transporting ATPase subunit epsilon